MTHFTIIALSFTTATLYHILWYWVFKDSLEDTDFAYVSYYGRKAANERNRKVLSESQDFPGFKTILYYVFYLGSKLSNSPTRGPRLLFIAFNVVGSLSFSIVLLQLTGSAHQTFIGTLIYCAISTAPMLGSLYLQSEFWALTFTSLSLSLVYSDHAELLFFAGMAMAVNPITVKPFYLMETVILFYLAPEGHMIEIVSGFGTCALLIFALYWKDGFFKWFVYHVKGLKVLNYFLKFSRDTSNGRHRRNLVIFLPLLGWFIFPLLLPAFLNPNSQLSGLWGLFSASTMMILIQYRFYRYHFVCLIPSTILLYSLVPLSWIHLVALVPIYLVISSFWIKDHKNLDFHINRKIRHYHTRNCISRPIARWIRENTKPNDRILVLGSSIQIYVHSERLSIYPQLFFTPEVIAGTPEQEERMKEALKNHPPEIIIPEQNCLNWQAAQFLTKQCYRLVKSFQYNSEHFPVYQKQGVWTSKETPLRHNLFIDCLLVDESGRCWNPLPAEGEMDPNPTTREQSL